MVQARYRLKQILRTSKQEKKMFNRIYELLKENNEYTNVFDFFKKIVDIIDELDMQFEINNSVTRNLIIDEIVKIIEFHKKKD